MRHKKTFTVNAESDALLISFYTDVILRNCRLSMQTFFIASQLLGGDAKTSPLLKIIGFSATSKFKTQY